MMTDYCVLEEKLTLDEFGEPKNYEGKYPCEKFYESFEEAKEAYDNYELKEKDSILSLIVDGATVANRRFNSVRRIMLEVLDDNTCYTQFFDAEANICEMWLKPVGNSTEITLNDKKIVVDVALYEDEDHCSVSDSILNVINKYAAVHCESLQTISITDDSDYTTDAYDLLHNLTIEAKMFIENAISDFEADNYYYKFSCNLAAALETASYVYYEMISFDDILDLLTEHECDVRDAVIDFEEKGLSAFLASMCGVLAE